MGRILWLLFPFSFLGAMVVGNPAQSALQTKGLFSPYSHWSFRLAYVGDFVYEQKFREEIKIEDCIEVPTFLQLRTSAALFTFNWNNRVDIYGLLGASRMQLDKEIFTKQQFAWGCGGKVSLFHYGRFRIGADVKYFESDQKPIFFACDDFAYNIASPFSLKYKEFQGALGMSYRFRYLSPYIHGTYLFAKIKPKPKSVAVRLPMVDAVVDAPSKSAIGDLRWGLALGATIIDQRKATLTLEWRAFNQNSVDVNGEVRF